MSFEDERNSLVDRLVSRGYVKTRQVEQAFRKTPRHLFVPEKMIECAYSDRPLPIGSAQTISAPHMVAIMSEALSAEKDSKILEVGAGSGYQAAILSHIAGEGVIYTIERVGELAALAKLNLARAGVENVKVCEADGTLGFSGHAPYDRIIVTAAAPKIPGALVAQLAEGGRLLIPVGGRMMQELKCVEKKDGEVLESGHGGCVFVPLIGEDGW